MADDAELQITIVEDPAEAADATTTVEVKKAAVNTVEVKDPALLDLMKQHQELKTKEEEATKRAQDAENRRAQAEADAARSREEAEGARKRETSSHLDTVTTAISASEQDVEGAKQAIRSAMQAGDIDAQIEGQDRLAKARATLLRLDEARQDIEARQKAPPKKQQPSDPVEAFASRLSPLSAAWVRAHPDYARSEKGMKKITAADAVAIAEDLIPDTPEYFARVEEYLGIRVAEKKDAPIEAAQVAPAKPKNGAPPVAPGAAVSSNGGGSGTAVQLTAREAAAAQDGTHVYNYDDPKGKFKKGEPIGLQEMARRKVALTRQGAYDRSFSEG